MARKIDPFCVSEVNEVGPDRQFVNAILLWTQLSVKICKMKAEQAEWWLGKKVGNFGPHFVNIICPCRKKILKAQTLAHRRELKGVRLCLSFHIS